MFLYTYFIFCLIWLYEVFSIEKLVETCRRHLTFPYHPLFPPFLVTPKAQSLSLLLFLILTYQPAYIYPPPLPLPWQLLPGKNLASVRQCCPARPNYLCGNESLVFQIYPVSWWRSCMTGGKWGLRHYCFGLQQLSPAQLCFTETTKAQQYFCDCLVVPQMASHWAFFS